MLKKLSNAILGMSLAFASILPMQFVSSMVKAEATENFIIVDDTETDSKLDHYFTYSPAGYTDSTGYNSWVSNVDNGIIGEDYAKSQHWMWNNNNNGDIARKYTYTFTFTGTGVEIYGVPNDPKNVFQLDSEKEEIKDCNKNGKNPVVLYSRKGLSNEKHTVKVSLPREGNVTGLQVCYAKVFGAKESNIVKEVIKPNKQDTEYNSFKFTAYEGKKWTASDKEAYIDLGSNDSKAEECYYEIPFVGSRIDIFATKADAHGKVKFSVDGNNIETVDLYKSGNREDSKVYSVSNLTEAPHILRAVTLNDKSGSKVVNQVVRAEVYHAPYVLESIDVVSDLELIREATYKLTVKAMPAYASLNNLKFSTSNQDIVSVDTKGNLTAKKVGQAQITVSADGVDNKVVNVTVKEQVKAMSGSIVDENLQWTQTKREEVSKMGTTSKNLTAWQADKAVAEFVVYAKQSSLKNVTLSVSDFTNGKNIISKENVSATFIKSTKAFTGMPGWGYQPGAYPVENETNRQESSDIIYTKEPVNVSYDKVQPVWVEVNVPKGTPAGVYTGTVNVESDDLAKDENLTFTFNLKVQDVELPDVSTYGNTFDVELWQYPYSSAEYYNVEPFSDKHMKILESIMLKYKSVGGHAITTTISEDAWSKQTYSKNKVHYPSMVKWTLKKGSFDSNNEISDDFEFEYDFTNFDKWVQFNKDLGIGDKIVLYSIAPWHNSFTFYDNNGNLNQVPYTYTRNVNGHNVLFYRNSYDKVWGDFFKAMVDHLDQKGWFNDAYVGIDERGLTVKAFDLLDTIKNKEGKTLKTAGAMDNLTSGDHPQLARRINDLNVGDSVLQNTNGKNAFDQLLKDRTAKGLRTTLYSCTGHAPGNFSLSAPGESYWSMMFAYKSGAAGFLRWAYDAWVENPLEDATHSSFEAGDCFLIYPDLKNATNPTAKSSLRLEKMAQGVRDINKLIMMSKEYPELKTDINTLLNNVQTKYQQSGYFLTEKGKLDVAKDMNAVHDGIEAITEKYIALRDKDGIANAKEELSDLLETAKPNFDKADQFTKESFDEFKEAYENAENILNDEEATLPELKEAIASLKEKIEGLTLKEEVKPTPDPEEKPDPEGNKPVNPDGEKPEPEGNKPAPETPSVPTKPENPENEVVENEETPSTGVSTNAVLLWTMLLGAGFATVALTTKKRKTQR